MLRATRSTCQSSPLSKSEDRNEWSHRCGVRIVRVKSLLTAPQAYARTVEPRQQEFTNVVAINSITGRRITEELRLLRDL